MTKEEIRRKVLLMMLDKLTKGQPFTYNGKKVEPQVSKSGIPFFPLKDGKLMLQNPNKNTIFALLAKKGVPIAWYIPNDNSEWELVTRNKLLHVYQNADSMAKRKITMELKAQLQ